MTRGGTKRAKDSAERRCIATGETLDKAHLMRFVVGPEGEIVPDLQRRLPGRGIWVRAQRQHVDKAAAKGLFSRAAKAAVKVPENLSDLIEELLGTRLINSLSLSRKAGVAVCGFEKVKAILVSESAEILFQASDGLRKAQNRALSVSKHKNWVWLSGAIM